VDVCEPQGVEKQQEAIRTIYSGMHIHVVFLPQGSCLHLSSPLLKTEEFGMWLEMMLMMMMILEINQVPKN
jgi:hypothetical protein